MDSLTTYSVEYAKSNRAACRGTCKNKIDKGIVRIGKSFPGDGDYLMTHWYHLACIKKPAALTSLADLSGCDTLKPDDQALVKAWFDGDTATVQANKRKTDEESAINAMSAPSTPKKQKTAAAASSTPTTPTTQPSKVLGGGSASGSGIAAVPPALSEELELREKAAALFSTLNIPDLKSCLRENQQLLGGTKPELVDRCVDRKLYGNLPRCPECSIGRLKVSYKLAFGHEGKGTFTCPGGYDDDQYVRCGFRSNDVDRPEWKVTEWETAAENKPQKSGGAAKSGGGGGGSSKSAGKAKAPKAAAAAPAAPKSEAPKSYPKVMMPGDDD